MPLNQIQTQYKLKRKIMLHNPNTTVQADNGVQIFLACDIELILNMAFDYTYENNTRARRYSDNEVCEHWDISREELERMKYTLSYEYCHDENGNYRFN
jgi:hypothetical protein